MARPRICLTLLLVLLVSFVPDDAFASRRTNRIAHSPSVRLMSTSDQAGNTGARTGGALSSSLVTTTSNISPPQHGTVGNGGSNPVFQMAGYVKDSVVRMVDGVGLMWRNYGRCNEIRTKQKQHRDTLRVKWEEGGVPRTEIKKRLKSVNGGISYDEYAFLVKGREDRGKLTQLMLISWGAPKFFPYALMFYPEMLPSAFAPQHSTGGTETKMQALSRSRSHTVVRTLLAMERDARVIPPFAKLNIFGRKSQQRTMERMDRICQSFATEILVAPVDGDADGAQLVLDTLKGEIYSEHELAPKQRRLISVPKSVIKGMAQAIEGGGSPIDPFLPMFVTRGKVLNHIKKVTESDEFMVTESVDLNDLGTQRLEEACKDRLIGGLAMSNDEMREVLSTWLSQSVVQPSFRIQESGEHYNGNMARAALMCYHSLQAVKDERSASYLPRSLFNGSASGKLSSPSVHREKNPSSVDSKKSRFF